MRNITLLFISLLLVQCSFAQNDIGRVCFLGMDTALHDWSCLKQAPTEEDSIAEVTLNALLKPIGLHAQFFLRECSEIQNFASLISKKSQRRYILYNRTAIDSIADPRSRNWDIIAIYLHELAHHLSGNTSNPNDEKSLEQELYADEFSGTQMARLKAKLTQAQGFLTIIDNPSCDDDADHSHPCLEKRLNAVAKGWYSGMGLEKFYQSISGKKFNASVSANSVSIDHYLKSDAFFEYKHCVRSDSPCDCNVILNEMDLKIDLQNQISSLTLKLTDQGGWEYKCRHSKLDTTIVVEGHFEEPIELLPDQKLRIEFPMYEYSQTLRFKGVLSNRGIITGDLISPNEHGASWAPDPNARGEQYIARIKLTAKN